MNFIKRCQQVAHWTTQVKLEVCQRVRGPIVLASMARYKMRGSSKYRLTRLTSPVGSALKRLMQRTGGLKRMEYLFMLYDGYMIEGVTDTCTPKFVIEASKSNPHQENTENLLIHCVDGRTDKELVLSIPYCYKDDGLPTFVDISQVSPDILERVRV